jgi:hypothetical protein
MACSPTAQTARGQTASLRPVLFTKKALEPFMRLKVLIAATMAFWLFDLLQSVMLAFRALPGEPWIATFTARYAAIALIECALFTMSAIVLSWFVLKYRWRFGAFLMVSLFVVFVWRSYLSGASFYFGPPLGDGSLLGAWHAYLVVLWPRIEFHVLRLTALVALAGWWCLVFFRIRKVQQQ